MKRFPVAGRKTLIARALSTAFIAGATSLGFVGGVNAQYQYTTGAISGQVPNPAGASVRVEGTSGGFSRTIPVEASGRFNVLALPVGEYRVSLIRGGAVERSEVVSVDVGSSTNVSFVGPQRVEVVGRASRIDASSTDSSTVFTSQELARIPVAQNVGAVIQLAPSTVSGDPRYGSNNAPSFGGSSGSENAYYINGFPVVNPLTQVGFSQLPFGAASQVQLLSGGYGAEYGRSTGGVVNIITKRGTNTYEAGFSASFEPKGLRSNQKDLVYPATDPTFTGQMFRADSKSNREAWSANVYASGPIVKDKLFFYVNAEHNAVSAGNVRLDATSAAAATSGWQEITQKTPRYFAKLDWNITRDHQLEYTGIRDRPVDERTYYGFDYATLARNSTVGGSVLYKSYGPTPIAANIGADVDILKWTGRLTNDLTLSAQTGWSKTPVIQELSGYNDAAPLITFTSTGRASGITYVNPQPFVDNVLTKGAYYKTKASRIDGEWRINDKHTLRAGLDNVKLDSYSGVYTPGNINYSYRRVDCGATLPGEPTGTPTAAGTGVVRNIGGVDRCYVIRTNEFRAVNPAKVDQSAQYIEDRWQVSDNVLLTLGLRNEQFENYNPKGEAFVKQDRQLEPRIGASWDVTGDSKFKVFGNYGRYHLQLPANVALRGAGPSTLLRQWLYYTGVDPVTGLPTGVTPHSAKYSPDGETGGPKDVGYVAAQDLKAHYQDEISIGFEKALSRQLNVGGKMTYRKLQNTLEDWCEIESFVNWANARGIGTAKLEGTGAFLANGPAFSCATINPGFTNRFLMDLDGDGKPEDITLTPQDMDVYGNGSGMPKAKRSYFALDFFAEHPFDGKWYGKVTYTWSKSKGNTEGQLNSDLGQADPAATQIFDHAGLMDYSYGYLPNDRRHVIKAFGYYNVTPEWAVGANALFASGRPKTCLGDYGGPNPANPASFYDPGSFYCLPAGVLSGATVPTPRGTVGRLPWQKRLDLSVSYSPDWLKGLKGTMTVFNVFNQQVPIQEQEVQDQTAIQIYRRVDAYSTPRYVRFQVQYDKKF